MARRTRSSRVASVTDQLDDLSGVPRYIQVARVIASEIRVGTWEIGQPVPSQVQLSQRFGVAKATAARSHARLSEQGYVVAVPGVGMVVKPRSYWPKDEPDTLRP
jgi:DNA-binding GntR family transcriptional regulator